MKHIPVLLFLLLPIVAMAQWTQKGSDIDAEASNDYFGSSTSISADGDVIAVGAEKNDGNGTDAGHVRVYAWVGSGWTQRGADIDGEAAGDFFGRNKISLSSDGSVLAVGASGNDGNGSFAGHVRVYSWNGTAWTQRGSDFDGEAVDDQCGWSCSLSSDGSILAFGAIQNDGSANNAGRVKVYSWNGTTWSQRGANIDGEAADDQSGRSVELNSDGTILAIGAPFNDAGSGNNRGHVRVYSWDGSAWTQRGADIDGEADFDNSGISIDLSSDGSIIAIGATGNDGTASNAGHVRVYSWNGTTWTQRGSDIDGEAGSDSFGTTVSLSDNGNVLAVGAPGNDGTASNAGHARVFDWNGTAWAQRFSDIDGEAASHFSGYVRLAADGNTLIIGAPGNIIGGTGQVEVYADGVALPIELLFFDAKLRSNSSVVDLTWQTATETNNDFFIVEKSFDAIQWDSLTKVKGAGNSSSIKNYYAVDYGPLSSVTYYRLKQVDYDGTHSYSEIKSVMLSHSINKIYILNDLQSGTYALQLEGEQASATMRLTNALGQVLFTKELSYSGTFPIAVPNISGVYFLELTINNGAFAFKLIND